MTLYVCYGTFSSPRPGGHPCGNAYKALKEAGYDPEVVKSYGLGMLPDSEPMPHHYLVCGAMPVFLAALLSAAKNMAPIAPDPTLSTAQDLLRMIRGQRAGVVFEKGLDTYLATVADHGFNASTFTARVVASTHAGLISAVLAGLCGFSSKKLIWLFGPTLMALYFLTSSRFPTS